MTDASVTGAVWIAVHRVGISRGDPLRSPSTMAVGPPDATAVTSERRGATDADRHVLEQDISDRLLIRQQLSCCG